MQKLVIVFIQRAMGFVAPDIDIRVIENRIVETPLEYYRLKTRCHLLA